MSLEKNLIKTDMKNIKLEEIQSVSYIYEIGKKTAIL